MGTRTQRIVFDDLDNSTDSVGTYRFAAEGIEYEIDLSPAHIAALRAALAPFVAAGRRQPRSPQRRADRSGQPARPGLRAWWADNAEQLALPEHRARGTIPAAVHTAYDNHH
jgi:hypothetical protein